MADDYYKKFKIIFERERSMARGLALSLIRFKTLTVWEIMIPVIFILNYVKLKQSREIFVQNQMFTKKMALDAALDMLARMEDLKAAMRLDWLDEDKEAEQLREDARYLGWVAIPHCYAMCGPLHVSVCALHREKSLKALSLFNLGRVFGYTVAGLLFGAFGAFINVGAAHYCCQQNANCRLGRLFQESCCRNPLFSYP